MSLVNLHAIVNPIIAQLHPNVVAQIYRSTGQVNLKGKILPAYAKPESIEIQIQSEGATTLAHANKVGMEEVSRKLYLHSSATGKERVAGVIRPLSRGGDMLWVGDVNDWYANTWWLVDGPIEDFSRSGWLCVRATMQTIAPDFSGSDWYNV